MTVVIYIGQHDVGRLDISVQKALIMCVVECARDRRDDAGHLLNRHSCRIPVGEKPRPVEAVYIIHRDPQVTVFLATVVHTDNVGMPKCRGEVRFSVEPEAVLRVR